LDSEEKEGMKSSISGMKISHRERPYSNSSEIPSRKQLETKDEKNDSRKHSGRNNVCCRGNWNKKG